MITEPFQGLAASFAADLGMPGYPTAVVAHPVASNTAAQLAARADAVADTLIHLLLDAEQLC